MVVHLVRPSLVVLHGREVEGKCVQKGRPCKPRRQEIATERSVLLFLFNNTREGVNPLKRMQPSWPIPSPLGHPFAGGGGARIMLA